MKHYFLACMLFTANLFAVESSLFNDLLMKREHKTTLTPLQIDSDVNGRSFRKHRNHFRRRCCKRGPTGPQGPQGPVGTQGPAGPAFNNFFSMVSLDLQPFSGTAFIPVSWGASPEILLNSAGQWSFSDSPSNTTLVGSVSGVYLVTFKANFNLGSPTFLAVGIQTVNAGTPILDSLMERTDINSASENIITLESSALISYTAGDPITFEFVGLPLNQDTGFFTPTGISAAVSIIRVN